MKSSSRTVLLSLAAGLCLLEPACKPKAVRGGAGTDNPNLDNAAMSTGLDRSDLGDLMKLNLDKLFTSPLWAQIRVAPQPIVIAIWPIKNDTSEHIDGQLLTLLSDMETEFINSGAVQVVSRERQSEMAAEVGIQNSEVFDLATASRLSKQVGAKYYVTGKIQSVDERIKEERRVQYSLFIQVIEVETSLVKFQNKAERTKAIVR